MPSLPAKKPAEKYVVSEELPVSRSEDGGCKGGDVGDVEVGV